jgi:radical SAM superfamily enzyme YgiQ (UPF0313 family)
MIEHLHKRGVNSLRVQLIGIAGTSRDILLSIFALKSFVLGDETLSESLTLETNHYGYILPSKTEENSQHIANDIAQFQPHLIGFSTYVWNYDIVIRTAELAKKANPFANVVLGGPEIAASDIIEGKFDTLPVDYIICGEGEMPFYRLLQYLSRGDDNSLKEISRLAHRVDGKFNYKDIDNPESDMLPDLSRVPSPYLSGVVPASLLSSGFQANIETQRGCNFRCAYCLYHANFPSIRYRKPEDIIDEIEFIYRCGIRDIRITDANFLSNSNYAVELLTELIRRNIRISFFFEVIPSFVDERIASLMKEYQELSPDNHILIGIGLQTINMESLRAIRRTLPIEHFNRAFALCSNAKVVIKTDIILGLPHETKKTYLDLMEYIADKMRNGYNYLSLAVLRILPGSELYHIAMDAGLEIDTNDCEHFVYQTPTMNRRDLVECMKISGIVSKFFHTLDIQSRISVRDKYFEVKDRLGVSHVLMFRHFVNFYDKFLAGTDSDYVKEDFPHAEHYWYFDMNKEVADEIIAAELNRLLENGIEEQDI